MSDISLSREVVQAAKDALESLWTLRPGTNTMPADIFPPVLINKIQDVHRDLCAALTLPPSLPPTEREPVYAHEHLDAVADLLDMWAKGECYYAPINAYDDPGKRKATIKDVQKSAAFWAPKFRRTKGNITNYFYQQDQALASLTVEPAPKPEASMLRNLLARVHGDGGHYLEAHGLEKSVEDADMMIAEWRAQPSGELDQGAWRWVPVEPTPEMVAAARQHGISLYAVVWKEVLAAAPTTGSATPYWLIERGSPAEYYVNGRTPNAVWSEHVRDAERFATKKMAERCLYESFSSGEAMGTWVTNKPFRICEHIDVSAAPDGREG